MDAHQEGRIPLGARHSALTPSDSGPNPEQRSHRGDCCRFVDRDLVTRSVTKLPWNGPILRYSAETGRERNRSSAGSIAHVCDTRTSRLPDS